MMHCDYTLATNLVIYKMKAMVLVLESWYKGSNNPSRRNLEMDKDMTEVKASG